VSSSTAVEGKKEAAAIETGLSFISYDVSRSSKMACIEHYEIAYKRQRNKNHKNKDD
jgi:hypothetical protein